LGLVLTFLLSLAGMIWTIPGQAAALKDVEFAALAGNQVRIDLVLSAEIGTPGDFAMDSPARIVLDLGGVTSELPRKEVQIDVGPVQSLRAVAAEDRTRVVINLTSPVPYQVQAKGERVSILINPPQTPFPQALSTSLPEAGRGGSGQPGPELRDIGFQRGPSNEGQVRVNLPNPTTRALVSEKGGKVLVEVLEVSLPERLHRRLDVVDFGTPVLAIETRAQGRDVAISIEPTTQYEYLAYQVNDLFTIEFRTPTPEQRERKQRERVTFTGERLTLNFQDIEVRAVLHLLADFTGHNLVASDTVTGNVTLRLKNVPWDQAIDIILQAKGLSMRQKGNVIMVGPTEEILAREHKELEAAQKVVELAPLRTEYLQINYAKAVDIANLLETQKKTSSKGSADVGPTKEKAKAEKEVAEFKGLLSRRGSVTADERTNTLLVQDTAEKLEEIRQLVSRLDIPVRQVMIESRVVIANDNFARQLGVRFGFNRLQVNENKGDFNEIFGAKRGTLARDDYWGTTIDDTVPLMVDLPATNPTSGVNFLIGKIGSYLLQLELTAMQEEGRGEIISNPRVITSDKQPAVIEVGQRIPIVTPGTIDQPATVKYEDATLKLDVIPHITPDNRIIMGLKVSKDEADKVLEVEGNPYINKRTVNTNVLVDNGETVVLGGVFERSRSLNKDQVPWLGDLPVIGNLFKNDARRETNQELLIFVTPRILQQELPKR